MTKRFRKPGLVITLQIAPYAVSSGNGVLKGSMFGVACADIANGGSGEIEIMGEHELTAVALQAWTHGAKLYWDDSAKNVTTSAAAGANAFIGHCTRDKANSASATTGFVRLHGANSI
jgi:predicted RecA/RadA family phage recombinase